MLEWLAGFVAASFVYQFVAQPWLRPRQWVEFGVKVRELDGRARANGWSIVAASFRPGWLFGTGEVRWWRGGEEWVSTVRVTGSAAPW